MAVPVNSSIPKWPCSSFQCYRYTAPPTRAGGFCWVHFAHFAAPCSLRLSSPTPGMSTEYGYCVFTGHLTGGSQRGDRQGNQEGEGLGGSGYGGLCPDPCRKPLSRALTSSTTAHTLNLILTLTPAPTRPGSPQVACAREGNAPSRKRCSGEGYRDLADVLAGLEGWLRTSDPLIPLLRHRPQTAVQCGPGVLDVVSSRL